MLRAKFQDRRTSGSGVAEDCVAKFTSLVTARD